jgi:hypothetical protein
MAQIGIERLAAGNRQKNQAERHQTDVAMSEDELDRVNRVDCRQNPRIVANV